MYIHNIYAYLKACKMTTFEIITTRVNGCWDDIEFDAKCAGYLATRYIDKKLAKNHLFAECYRFTKI